MIGSFTNYPSMNSPLGLATQYSLRFGLVVGLDPPRHAVHVSFRDTNEFTGYSLPVLMPWADGYYISQSPLPRKGTLVLCAFPMGDDRNGVVIGSLYGSNLSAITSGVSENDAYIDYARYPNNIWRMADDNANLTWAHPSGLTLNINNSGTTPLSPTYNITSSANPELTEVLPVPAPAQTPSPYIYITHPSGSSLLLDPSGNYTTKITGTSSSSISGNVSQTYLGTMTTQVTSDIQTSSGTQIVNQVGSAASTALTATSATSTIGTISHEVSAAGITASNAGAPFMSVTSAGAMTLLAGVAATGFTIGGNSVVTSFNGAYGAIVADLNTLSGVSISNPTSGQVLTYNGTDWVNGTGGGGGDVSSVFGRTGAVVAEVGDYSAFYGQLGAANTWTGNQTLTSAQSGTTALASPSFTFQGWSGSAAVDYSIFTDSSGDLEIDYGSTKIITSSSTGVINAAGFTIGGNSVVTSFNGRYGAVTPATGDYTLSQIGTVSLTSPANGQVLEYNGTDWVNASIVSGVSSVFGRTGAVVAAAGDYTLSQIGTVVLTSPTNGQVLTYNGTDWVNAATANAVSSVFGRTGAVTAEAGDYTLSQIGTVSLTSPTNGQVLEYNGTDWVNASIVSGVSSVFGRTGAVTAEAGDYTLTLVGDGTARFAVVNAGSLNGVSYVDANNRALIDFTQVTQHGNIIDNVREATAAWAANTAVTAGYLIKDSNGNAQEATNDGTTGTTAPTWSTTLNGTTDDNGVIWVMVGTTTMTRIAISNTDGNNNVDLSQPNIVNFNSLYEVDGAGWENTAVWGDVSQTPTTLAGYGITNGQVSLGAAAGTNYILMQTNDDGPFWTSPSVQAGNLNYGNTGIESITLNSSTAFQLGNALEFPNPGVPVAISVRVTGEIFNTYTTNQQIGLYCKVSTDGGSTFTSGTELYYTILANTIHLNVSIAQFVNTVTATGSIIVQLWGYNSGNTDSMTLYAMMEATLYPNVSFSVIGPPLSASVPSTATGSCSYTYGSASSCTANTDVTVSPNGGSGGYTYAWAVTSGSGTLTNATSQTVTVSQTEAGSSSGTQYTTDVDCVVTDSASASVTSNTCAVTQTFTYTYAALTVSVSVTDGSCKATSGNSCTSTSSGKINVTGGDGNYSYSTVITSGPGTISNATSQTFDITYSAVVSYSVTTDTNSTVSDPVVASASATASLTNTGKIVS